MLAPRSRLRIMPIPLWVKTTGTPHRPIMITVFKRMVIEKADILCLAIRLSSSLIIPPIYIKAMGSKAQPFKQMPDHSKQHILQMETALPRIITGNSSTLCMITALYYPLYKPHCLRIGATVRFKQMRMPVSLY